MRRKWANQVGFCFTIQQRCPRCSLLSMSHWVMHEINVWRGKSRTGSRQSRIPCQRVAWSNAIVVDWHTTGSTSGSNGLLSCRLAGEISGASRMPLASSKVCSLEPGFPCSTGFGLVSSTPFFAGMAALSARLAPNCWCWHCQIGRAAHGATTPRCRFGGIRLSVAN